MQRGLRALGSGYTPDTDPTVLLVEADARHAYQVADALARSSEVYAIHHVESLQDAFTALQTREFDVMLLDLHAAQPRGVGTLLLRIQATSPTMPVIVVSNLEDEALAVQAVKSGAQDYLVKERDGIEGIVRAVRYARERKCSLGQLQYLAHHDTLTGLANRELFRAWLGGAWSRSRRTGEPFAVLFVDLDHFKEINDTMGHDAGDQLLKVVAARIGAQLRECDLVARLGGDEFAILVDSMTHQDDAVHIAHRVLGAIEQPADVGGTQVNVGASIGIAVHPLVGSDRDELLSAADQAMYAAKQHGRGRIRLYQPEMGRRAMRRLELESALRHALENEEFELHYQPQVHVPSGAVTGVEALLRWHRPETGTTLTPAHFLDILEASPEMVTVGSWVIDTAVAQLREWLDASGPVDRMAVNVSARQFQHPELANTVLEALSRHGVEPTRLELEITESVLLADSDRTIKTMETLRDAGVRLALDDFGTGYSSMTYLHRFPVDTLKIDRSFVADVDRNSRSASIVGSILDLGRRLQLHTVAEGVETVGQARHLSREGCLVMQGYLYGAPAPAEAQSDAVDFGTTWATQQPTVAVA